MKGLTNFLRGNVTLRISGPFPERFLNICGANGVSFWHVRWESGEELTLRIPRSKLHRAQSLGKKALCQVEAEEFRGIPDFLLRFRRRYGFLLGLFLALVAVGLLSQVVLVVDVSGNETVPTQTIVEELENAGLKIGSFGPWITARDIAHRVLLQESRLSYMAVNLHGIRAEVIVRESIQKPDIVDTETPSDLVAGTDGLVTRVEIWSGVSQVEVGDVVAKGDLLVSGHKSYDNPDTGETFYEKDVASLGKIWARTWKTLSASVPLSRAEKVYTGECTNQYRLNLWGHTLKFYENSSISYERYDKITTMKQLTLPGGIALPLTWETDTCSAYETQTVPVDRSSAQAELEQRLTQRLQDSLGEEDSITNLEFQAEEENGWLTVTLQAECCQQIGVQTERLTQGKDETND
jgi:similar to stage IV sporulation protein